MTFFHRSEGLPLQDLIFGASVYFPPLFKAVLVGFLNRFSCYGVSCRVWPGATGKLLRHACWFTPWGLTRLVRANLGPRPMRLGSVLVGPKSTWREAVPWRQINSLLLPVPVGAVCACAVNATSRRSH